MGSIKLYDCRGKLWRKDKRSFRFEMYKNNFVRLFNPEALKDNYAFAREKNMLYLLILKHKEGYH